ncbi:uncharacterized protein LOC105216238 isoform X1 [Zeugodacus cucurbitae]|uniref:uncharacterized protein LOC105216238 isoform X1 n=1 Tax=Zeugodacus cucurbitae TaxID=28588 RepID=UPI0023D8ECEA|nr:uncharacterized protein LOC105216238 isoform X1 [Zeugodacus cucurbitae]XP_054087179.1 uncharacterized protein LOC105216238 isoform X1 [Zeugodacus cucurbitae]XP_054087180.1 uncharacterized protein LOC105216238 isoform X1 [Zeugodacus cucurbitae]XP_054087181.1 uncharacterized protein LOC105216238 isoform X1 [Zeugodacus cucurbitae]XP_054087182.1 uncharacterized protein LOC105216238 isoform X1 [Zeugodacus cucurbitae]XP_054087183.1 uncharacterized protein LOC105216238 isoform X1 [Zeugodacus cucur
MADFDKKFKEMQKFLPFLQNVIEKLRSSTEQSDDNPRKEQLKKMEVLHDLLKSNGKKLKMETLQKCEALLIKLHSKMERIPFLQSENETSKPTNQTSNLIYKTTTKSNTEVPSDKNTTVYSVDIVDITGPESPPPQPLEEVPPVEIPTERRCSPMPDVKSSRTERDKHKHIAHKNERNYKQHSSQQQPERHHHHTQALNHNRSVEKTKINTNDSSQIFNRRSVVSAEIATDTANKYPFDPLRNRDPRASNAFTHEIYSPEECWDNPSSGKRTATNANHTAVSTDLATAKSLRDQTYHDTIFNFKKSLPKTAEMFSRVRNLEQPTAGSNRTAAISMPVKVPTIPDVLKSPPLSASDISDLLKESGGKVVPSISEIGIRRPAKDTVSNNIGTTVQQISPMEAATLDQVRKKFAIVTKSSPQLRDSPDVLKSPLTSSPKDIPTSLPKERIALKYNPHPRTERNTQPIGSSSSSASVTHVAQPIDPRLTHRRLSIAGNNLSTGSTSNALNSAAPHDPRLRNVAASTTTSGLYKPTSLSINTNATNKPPLKQPHIPSLLDVKVADPRKSYNANFTNTTMVPRQHVGNNMPANQTQAAIFSRRDFPIKTTAPVVERPTVQKSKSGYSSEENWDSDPETPAVPKVVTQPSQPTQNQPFTEPVKARDGHTDAGFRSVKPPLLPTPTFGRPIGGNGSKPTHHVNPHFPNPQHSQSVPQYSNNCKFSALLNDKTERSKYFESKKQKQSEPRTYMEHRKAKARAAAEDAARKAAAIETTKTPTKDIGEVSDVDSSVLAKLSEHPPVASTLDKLYRSTDFTSCEFPKAKTSFKIPKKPAEKTIEKPVAEPKVVVENKEDVKETQKEPLKDTSTTIQDDTKKTEEKMPEPKKIQEGTSEKQQGKKNNNKESAKKVCVDTKNKSSENVKKKPVSKGGVQSKSQATLNTDVTKIQNKCNKSEEVVENNITKTVKEMGLSIKISPNSADSSKEQANNTTEPKQSNETQKTVEDNPILESATDKSDIEKSGAENLVSESPAKDECNETKSMPTKEVDCKSLSTAMFLKKLQGIGKPARILQRRNTMMVRGSLPEVDKEKIFPIKSLVYEDIQGAKEEELRKEIAKMPKMNKSLAEMFQKTDDNCKVSTQNIISGKRRTRTNVNFNEVQRSLEIFNHKRRSEPLKQPVEKASPVTIKKKVSPKGKKGAKGKAKNDTSVDTTCEEELVKTENIEQVTATKTEKKPTKRRSAKVIKWEEALESPEPNKADADNEAASIETNEETVDKIVQVEEATTTTVVVEKSVKPISRIDALMDEDAQKRLLLESFVHDILNPKKDKAQIFSLLSQILSEDNLKFVKEIVDSAADKTATQNEEVNEEVAEEENNKSPSVEALNVNNAEEKTIKNDNTAAVCAPKPIKSKGKWKGRKNELDRLNEDIRTMFISQGVLTATGRRMCTLVAAAEEANKTDANTDKNATPHEVAEAEVICKSPAAQAEPEIPTVRRLRKAKVLLKHIDFKEIKKSADIAETEMDEVSADKSPPRKMPILKPHTPIKQSDIEDEISELAERPAAKRIKLDTDVKRVHTRPGPKCSKKQPIAISSDDDVTDADDNSSDNKVMLPALMATKKKSIVKNTNKEWHSQSKWAQWCVLCDIKITQPATHYMRSHGEFYAARLAPNILEKLKVGEMNKPYFSVLSKKVTTWFYRCPFCLQYKRMQWQGWLKHLIMHTGEYNFECSKCQRPAAMACQLEYHVKHKCLGATVVRKNAIPFDTELRAHVCHRCHFIQLIRENMDKHFVQQHGIAKTRATKMGFTIVLFDTTDVQLIENSRTLELETKIINEGLETIDIVENATAAETKSKDESIDSDDIPIAVTLQCNKAAEAKKIAVEKALSSNIFVPTRETNESPTMNNFAQSLFTITTVQETAPSSSGISIAERLSQKFKNIQSNKAATIANIDKVMDIPNTIAAEAVERAAPAPSITDESSTTTSSKEVVSCPTLENQFNSATETALSTNTVAIAPAHEQQLNSTIETALPTDDVSITPEIEQQLNSSTETALSTMDVIKTAANETSDQVIAASTSERIVDSPIEDDDDNWEDIEITESAPSTTSSTISAASSTNNKSVKTKNKNVLHKLNRLYATNNKLKKSLTLTIGSRKREERRDSIASNPFNKENAVRTAVINVDKSNEPETVELPTINATSTDTVATAVTTETTVTMPCIILSTNTVTQSTVAPATTTNAVSEKEAITVATAAPILGFRPLITNLDDLLPDSPCNDPLELVPELTPMESLQDLCDVSSILNSDYMSDNWLTNTTTSNLNNDNSQQANMQEALDFVKEQQSVQCSVNTTMPLAPLASIQRIQNIGYSKSVDDNTYKFYCLSDNCTFLYSSELIGLESHFRCEHAQAAWNGYCHSCKAKVEATAESMLPLSAELSHMSSKHLIVASAPPSLPIVDDLRQTSKSNSPALDEDRPRIKIRRLTGDCLSTTPTPTTTQSSKTVSTFDENAQLVALTQAASRLQSTITTSFLNQLPTTVDKQSVENRHFENIGLQAQACPLNIIKPSTTTPCQLQIASVVSLQDQQFSNAVAPTAPLPVISNVCSLNSRSVSSPVNNVGSLWAQHIVDERTELERAAAESMEVSRILSSTYSNTPTQSNAIATSIRTINDSPEPQVVAETVPVAQATSGNYLITQTVSAQYVEGRVGFNISIANNPAVRSIRSDSGSNGSTTSAVVAPTPQFKCMANACKYQTRLPVAMVDHIHFHDRQNFSPQREYLRCSQCTFLAEDVDGFIQHSEQKHGMFMRSATDIGSTITNGSPQTTVGNTTTNQDTNKRQEQDMPQTFTQKTWETALKEIVATTGVPDSKLFRCTVEDCKTRLNESTYFSHVVYHLSTLGQKNINNRTYKCSHCYCSYNKPQKIKAHIKTHGVHKYFCYLCTQTAINVEQMHKHFEERHWRSKKLRSTPLPYKQDATTTYYVIYTTLLSKYEIQQFREKLIAEWQRKKSSARTHFKPSEIGLMPLTPIFGKDLNCAICAYKTKVRTNLMRHLQMHTDDSNGGAQPVANVDPVNPVPCLNSSEKHFDKMTNLASSSLVVSSSGSTSANSTNASANGCANGKAKFTYDYVPDTKRFTCGVSNCQYLTISDDIFRSHLNALHSDITVYNCPHCKEENCKRGLSVDRILGHLRFHGAKLYVCDSCGYMHYMRTVVERHIRQHDVHPPLFVKVIECDRTKENTAKKVDNTPTPTGIGTPTVAPTDTQQSKCKQKWTCNLCGHKTMTQQQIIAHTTAQHSCKNQYQCMHCAFNATQLIQIMSHIDEKHAGKKREARYVYEKLGGKEEEEEDSNNVNTIDTRPLWQRDDPTRVRHIRGILMEDEEESERYRKRLRLDDIDEIMENDDGDENININQFGLVCYYCCAQCASPKELFEEHWQATVCTKYDAKKPLRFRLGIQLKCAHCLAFVGNSQQLMKHMKEVHKATKYVAADPHATGAGLTCGHCGYHSHTLLHLAQHTTRMRHKPFDLKTITIAQLEKLKALGTPLSYVHCLSCMELLADQAAYEAHVLARANVCDNNKSQKLVNKLIYACPFCAYTSQNEIIVLRHMIEHYSGFKRCYFCTQPQATFNGYMQHCYSDHREEIKNFCVIFTIHEISKYLQQLLVVFPNGLTFNLNNLRLVQGLRDYGNKHIKQLYEEIQKTSQQPPIPRLSLGRLVAKKCSEAKMSPTATKESASVSTAAALQLAGNNVKQLQTAFKAQKIMKRRSTIALGRDEAAITHLAMNSPTVDARTARLFNVKKRKIQHNLDLLPPPTATITIPTATTNSVPRDPLSLSDNETEPQPFSYYGQTPEPIDFSKVFIKIAAANTVETKINISKFKLLYNIAPRVLVTPTDMTKYCKPSVVQAKYVKPCPASHKIRYT